LCITYLQAIEQGFLADRAGTPLDRILSGDFARHG